MQDNLFANSKKTFDLRLWVFKERRFATAVGFGSADGRPPLLGIPQPDQNRSQIGPGPN
jgi:hypothetical protein